MNEPSHVNADWNERLTKACADQWEGKFTSFHKIINEVTFKLFNGVMNFVGK